MNNKNQLNCLIISIGHKFGHLAGWLWLSVSDEVAVKSWARATVIWRLVWGWKFCFQHSSLTQLLAGGLGSSSCRTPQRASLSVFVTQQLDPPEQSKGKVTVPLHPVLEVLPTTTSESNLHPKEKEQSIYRPTKVRLVKAMVFPVVMYGCESWTVKKAECQKIDAFELWCWRRLLSPLDCKEIQPVCAKGDQSWVFIGRTDAEAEPPPHVKSWLIGKDPDAGRD